MLYKLTIWIQIGRQNFFVDLDFGTKGIKIKVEFYLSFSYKLLFLDLTTPNL